MQLIQNNCIFAPKNKTMSDLLNLEKSLLPHLGRTAKFMDFYFIDVFNEHGIALSKEQWLVLKVLSMDDGKIQNDLAFVTNRSKTALTRLITTMEKKGLVYRVSSKIDKRINHVYMSDLGRSHFNQSIPIIKQIKNELQENISEEDIKKTIQVINQVFQNINNKTSTHQK